MTTLAVLADIHGNMPALEAIAHDLAQFDVQQVIVAGDLVGWGPQSPEVLDYVTRAGWTVMRGNHEWYILDYGTPRAPEDWRHHLVTPWLHRQLQGHWQTTLALWPDGLCLRFPDAPPVRVFHAGPRSHWDVISHCTTASQIDMLLKGVQETTVIVGHTHLQMDRTVGPWHIINPGGAGMPLDGIPQASYALIEGDERGWRATLQRVPFDQQALWRAFEQQGMIEACGQSAQLVIEEFKTARLQIGPFFRWRAACCPDEPVTADLLQHYAQINPWPYRSSTHHVNVAVSHSQIETQIGTIELVRAEQNDLDTVLDLLNEAAHWLLGRGIDQWQPGQIRREWLAERIRCGEVYLARQDDQALGTITLQWTDAVTWSDLPDNAGYVHKLAVRRSIAGAGLGAQLLRWAEAAASEAGKQFLRLDCQGTNQRLCRYYERAGFTPRGRMRLRGWDCQRYEKQLAPPG